MDYPSPFQQFLLEMGIDQVMLAIVCFSWMPYTRIIHADMERIRHAEFIVAAQSIGARPARRADLPRASGRGEAPRAVDLGSPLTLASVDTVRRAATTFWTSASWYVRTSALQWTILWPGFLSNFRMRGEPVLLPVTGRVPGLTTREAVADVAVRCLQSTNAIGQVFIVVDHLVRWGIWRGKPVHLDVPWEIKN